FVSAHYQGAGSRGVSAEFVQDVKEKIAQQGNLEFRIVANEHMDGLAIKTAQEMFRSRPPEQAKETDYNRAVQGLPPDAPTPGPDAEPWAYTYSWVELGRDERRSLGLNNAAQADTTANSRWAQVAAGREKGEPVLLRFDNVKSIDESKTGYTTMLVYSRKCENAHLSPTEREQKAFDYFVLLRNPAGPDKAITGADLIDANVN